MAAIARRTLLALFFVSPEDEIRESLARLANHLGEGNLSGFLRYIAKDFPDREDLRYRIAALMNGHDLTSSIQIQSVSGDSSNRVAQVDWYLAGRSKIDNAIAFQRREVLNIEFSFVDRRWVIRRCDFVSLFSPAR